MMRGFFAWASKYENHLSALAMIVGFVVDQLYLGRIDLPRTQLLFAGYIATCVISIALLHLIESRADNGSPRPRWRPLLPFATQFALGGFWSGFLFFYGRSAVYSASWPFIAILAAIFVANEVLRKYHDRLIFTTVLFYFALFSYIIFALPIYTHYLGRLAFIESGLFSLFCFGVFLLLLQAIGSVRLLGSIRGICIGVGIVFAVINLFYFTHVLPPLPLAARDIGIYHGVVRSDTTYKAQTEHQPWCTVIGCSTVVHTVPGESLYAYSAVFAPIALTTHIVHVWQWYDSTQKVWVTKNSVSFPITGGRDGGYRGYSTKAEPAAGQWRVDVVTSEGGPIARISFTVEPVSLPPTQIEKTLE